MPLNSSAHAEFQYGTSGNDDETQSQDQALSLQATPTQPEAHQTMPVITVTTGADGQEPPSTDQDLHLDEAFFDDDLTLGVMGIPAPAPGSPQAAGPGAAPALEAAGLTGGIPPSQWVMSTPPRRQPDPTSPSTAATGTTLSLRISSPHSVLAMSLPTTPSPEQQSLPEDDSETSKTAAVQPTEPKDGEDAEECARCSSALTSNSFCLTCDAAGYRQARNTGGALTLAAGSSQDVAMDATPVPKAAPSFIATPPPPQAGPPDQPSGVTQVQAQKTDRDRSRSPPAAGTALRGQ